MPPVNTDRETGGPFNYLSHTNVGSFSGDMGRIGSSNVRSGTFQCPGAEMSGYFENVVFSIPEPIPEPTSLVSGLIGLGMVGRYLRRRARSV